MIAEQLPQLVPGLGRLLLVIPKDTKTPPGTPGYSDTVLELFPCYGAEERLAASLLESVNTAQIRRDWKDSAASSEGLGRFSDWEVRPSQGGRSVAAASPALQGR